MVYTLVMPVRKVAGGWKIDNVPGVSKTRPEAVRRLRAVKINQRKRRK